MGLQFILIIFIVLRASRGQQTVNVIGKCLLMSNTADSMCVIYAETCLGILTQLYIIAQPLDVYENSNDLSCYLR